MLKNKTGNIIPLKARELNRRLIWEHRFKPDLVKKISNYYYYLSLFSNLRRLLANEQIRYCADNPRNDEDIIKFVLDGQSIINRMTFSIELLTLNVRCVYQIVQQLSSNSVLLKCTFNCCIK